MANDFTATGLIPRILAGVLPTLRETAWMPRLVTRRYEEQAGRIGSTIDIPKAGASAVRAVSPSYVPPAPQDVTPEIVSITLDKWYESTFYMTDKDLKEVANGIVPEQANEAVRVLSNQINSDLLALYDDIYGFAGTAGTTPFATDTGAATEARKVLFNQLAPPYDRYAVIDGDAEANALGLRAFQDNAWRGDAEGLREGMIGRKLGFDWMAHNGVKTHTAGTASGATTDATGYAVGVKTVGLASAGTGTLVVGDIITFAGDTQTYVITSGDADVSNGGSISFEPGLKVAIAASATNITRKATHVANLAFQRGAFAFASRPLDRGLPTPGGNMISVAIDQESGIALRLEVSRQHRQTQWAFDVLYGVKTIRPELATRIAG